MTTSKIKWDSGLQTWIPRDHVGVSKQVIDRGDAFWGGAIIGVALAGVLQCVVMMFAFL